MRKRTSVLVSAVGIALAWAIVAVRVRREPQRPELAPDERWAIDVSRHQGAIDWARVAGDGVRVAYIKATEGGDFVDETFAKNWAAARAAGIERGAYHFFTLCCPGAEQAENFLRTVPGDADALAPAIDLELTGNCSARPPREALLREVTAFVERIEAERGARIVLYVLDDIEARYALRHAFERPLWLRSAQRPTDPEWRLWQLDLEGKVTGIDGAIDLDIARGR